MKSWQNKYNKYNYISPLSIISINNCVCLNFQSLGNGISRESSSSRTDVIWNSFIVYSEWYYRKYGIFCHPLFFSFLKKSALNLYFFQIGALLGGDLNNSNGGCPSPVRKWGLICTLSQILVPHLSSFIPNLPIIHYWQLGDISAPTWGFSSCG